MTSAHLLATAWIYNPGRGCLTYSDEWLRTTHIIVDHLLSGLCWRVFSSVRIEVER